MPQCGHASHRSALPRLSKDHRSSFATRAFLKSLPQRGQRSRFWMNSDAIRITTTPPPMPKACWCALIMPVPKSVKATTPCPGDGDHDARKERICSLEVLPNGEPWNSCDRRLRTLQRSFGPCIERQVRHAQDRQCDAYCPVCRVRGEDCEENRRESYPQKQKYQAGRRGVTSDSVEGCFFRLLHNYQGFSARHPAARSAFI
jgi:hypothetical protein